MEFSHLLHIVGNEPVFETGLLLADQVDPRDVRRQLSRWVKAGRLSCGLGSMRSRHRSKRSSRNDYSAYLCTIVFRAPLAHKLPPRRGL